MREKSSSVFTSFSSRRLLRWATSSCSRTSPAAPLAGASRLVQRPEQQRQRRAEFVADVAEERRLRAVQLGERLRAPPLLLVGMDVGQPRGDLADEQADEAPAPTRRSDGTD